MNTGTCGALTSSRLPWHYAHATSTLLGVVTTMAQRISVRYFSSV